MTTYDCLVELLFDNAVFRMVRRNGGVRRFASLVSATWNLIHNHRWTEQKSGTISDYVLGVWVTNNPGGARDYPYSTYPNVNPLRYSSLARLGEVHGECTYNPIITHSLVLRYRSGVGQHAT